MDLITKPTDDDHCQIQQYKKRAHLGIQFVHALYQ